MKSRFFSALTCSLVMTLSVVAMAQEPQADDPLADEGVVAETWDTYLVKAYSIQIFGGFFGGGRYLDLPVMGEQTEVQEGTQRVMGYDGNWLEPGVFDYNRYDGPKKSLEDGLTAGVRVGTYLADRFHMDMTFSYTKTEAFLTMMDIRDRNNQVETEIDRDDNVQILRGSLKMMYDLDDTRLFGVSPYLGFGFGGIITRFSNLKDVGGLFLVGTVGVRREIATNTSAFLQFDVTTYAMDRDELHYNKTVAFTDITAGVSLYLDVVPADVRSRHEEDKAGGRRRR